MTKFKEEVVLMASFHPPPRMMEENLLAFTPALVNYVLDSFTTSMHSNEIMLLKEKVIKHILAPSVQLLVENIKTGLNKTGDLFDL